jgi:hypothetical protein
MHSAMHCVDICRVTSCLLLLLLVQSAISSGVTTGRAAGAGAPGPRASRGPCSRLSFIFSTATSLLKYMYVDLLGGKCTKLADTAALVHAGMSHREQELFRRVTPVADIAYVALHHSIQNGWITAQNEMGVRLRR